VKLYCLAVSTDHHSSEANESNEVQNWRHLQLLVL